MSNAVPSTRIWIFFTGASRTINSSVTDDGYHPLVTGEAGTDVFWDNLMWPVLPGNEGQLEPRFTNPDYLYHLNPDLKVIIVLKNPTHRLLSDYSEVYKRLPRYEPLYPDFRLRTLKQLDILRVCLRTEPLRTCLYDGVVESFVTPIRIRAGLYYPLLQDWLRAFPRGQVHVINYDTFVQNREASLSSVFKFLRIREPSHEELARMAALETDMSANVDTVMADTIEMQNQERRQLDILYRPFNRLLAAVLADESFLWENDT
nr:hypothetical protein BaRGS_022467 [Batillaria attramentaria]